MDENTKEIKSIYMLVNKAKGILVDTTSQVISMTGLPPYIIDGILSGILADIRSKEIYDMGVLLSAEDNEKKEDKKKEDDDGGHQPGTGTNQDI